jgi:hypothetical protein
VFSAHARGPCPGFEPPFMRPKPPVMLPLDAEVRWKNRTAVSRVAGCASGFVPAL